MLLYIVQHGKSKNKESEPEQNFTETGIAEIKLIAEVAKSYHVNFSEIRHSVKPRAKQTAEIFCIFIGKICKIVAYEGLKPLDDVTLLYNKLIENDDVI